MSRPIEDVTWQQVMFADISGQLKRYGARPDYFDGCLVKRGIFLGVWLQIVLVRNFAPKSHRIMLKPHAEYHGCTAW